ncbi:MAG: MAPEG family protein [Bdellovibrionales bacterium]
MMHAEQFAYPLTAMVTLAALILYFWITIQVGRARMKHKILPPHINGPEEFLRVLRTAQNTTENLVLFIPLLWLCAGIINDAYAAAAGGIWPLGRLFYAMGYYLEAEKRFYGFFLNMASYFLLLAGCLVGLYQTFASL